MRHWCAVIAAALLAVACSTPKPDQKEKLLTDAQMRAKLNDFQTSRALAELTDPSVHDTIERYFTRRSGELRARGLKLAVDRAMPGEDIGIGDGLALKRVFALFHEYNDTTFDTRLAAFELVGGAGATIRLALTAPVGGSGRAFATLDAIDLDRAILSVTTFKEKDLPCCPSVAGQTAFQLRGLTLEPLR